MTTQALAGLDAIAATIASGANPPRELLPPRFYRDGEVPVDADGEGPPLPYFLLGAVVDDPGGFYQRQGSSALYVVHCWATTQTKALRLYTWLHGLLHDAQVDLDGFSAVWRCKVRLRPGGRDATSEARQVIAEIEMEAVT